MLSDGREIRSSVVSSQIALHAVHGGVVPELAARAHLEGLATVVDAALAPVPGGWDAIDAVAVTRGPGLAGCLIVGAMYATSAAIARGLPLVGVSHLAGHVYSAWLADTELEPPYLALLVSGGHTECVVLREHGVAERLAATRDDAAGEAFDKVARLLGLEYPGGPAIQRIAATGDPTRFPLPRTRLDGAFSFSGLKTAVRYLVRDLGPGALTEAGVPADPQVVADLAASFQVAAVDQLVTRPRGGCRSHRGHDHRRRRRGGRQPRAPRGGRRALPRASCGRAALRSLHGQRGDDRGSRLAAAPRPWSRRAGVRRRSRADGVRVDSTPMSDAEPALQRSETAERYLEAIYYIEHEGEIPRPGRLAEWLGVSAPTVTVSLQRLARDGLVSIAGDRSVELTEKGAEAAARIVRRHRIVERWMTDVLGLDWATADLQAAQLTHGMSDVVLDRLDDQLGRPTTCPHGNVIPGRTPPEGRPLVRLVDLADGEHAKVARISEVAEHEAPQLLHLLDQRGIMPGIDVGVIDRSPAGWRLRAAHGEFSIDRSAAWAVWVESPAG